MSTMALTVAAAVSCSSPQPQPAAPMPVAVAPIRDIMHNLVEYNAFKIFNSVAVTITAKGTEEKMPRTDEDWDDLLHAAVTLAEAPNLLVMPGRRVSKPEEENSSDGPEELTPKDIQVKIDANRDSWLKHVTALQNVGKETMQIVAAKNTQGLFDVGEKIDMVCENCHLEFWYPNEAAANAARESGAAKPSNAKP
ncbi:MAG: hypothetical protein HY824_16910 [Acidobacteria bacterium]|nr:hypothetical protein [Acidobacteriota bacterium]